MSRLLGTLIINARIVNEGAIEEGSALLIEGKRIKRIYNRGDQLPQEKATIVDARGKLCLPGVIDDQVHFRDPGLTHKGDLASESSASLLGGVTSWMEMPNTLPQTTTLEAWEEKMKRAKETCRSNYSFYFGATNDNTHLLGQLNVKQTPGVKVFMGSSTGNMLVDSPEALERIFRTSPLIVAVHSESEEIIQHNKKAYQTLYGEDPSVVYHPFIRSREACLESTKKAIRLAKETGARLHILHLSTREEVDLLRSLQLSNITAEVCVHHLWFDASAYESLGTLVKWNPAIKESTDKMALREGLLDGTLSVVATDHAPHLLREKEGGAFRAASGGPMVQFSLPLMLELGRKESLFSPLQVVEWMCHRPAMLFNVKDRGFLREGYYADIVLVDDQKEWQITKDIIRSKCQWSPVEGEVLNYSITDVFLNGNHVVIDGVIQEVLAVESAMALEFEH